MAKRWRAGRAARGSGIAKPLVLLGNGPDVRPRTWVTLFAVELQPGMGCCRIERQAIEITSANHGCFEGFAQRPPQRAKQTGAAPKTAFLAGGRAGEALPKPPGSV